MSALAKIGMMTQVNKKTGAAITGLSKTDNDKIEISSDLQVLQNIVQGKGPKMSLLALGYCSWTPGQLEQEIKDNHWFVLPSNNQTIFETSNQDKWLSALENFNISPYNLSLKSGNC